MQLVYVDAYGYCEGYGDHYGDDDGYGYGYTKVTVDVTLLLEPQLITEPKKPEVLKYTKEKMKKPTLTERIINGIVSSTMSTIEYGRFIVTIAPMEMLIALCFITEI
ncbi:unnamed protein product [Brachionus calyciflorus]|uniref:Uncharacterized protein n=1 Tax=Brachionus calyciflorus TaxID=104777 RepID=A0A813S3T0_9BILA|nr:unnamed protein product [Brachionus calyciflorus]